MPQNGFPHHNSQAYRSDRGPTHQLDTLATACCAKKKMNLNGPNDNAGNDNNNVAFIRRKNAINQLAEWHC